MNDLEKAIRIIELNLTDEAWPESSMQLLIEIKSSSTKECL